METMTEPQVEAQFCATQKCKRPLTRLGPPQNCWRCLVCNPIMETAPTAKKPKKYVDVTLTEERVREIIREENKSHVFEEDGIREIVQDELMNWHIQKPPVTRDEIANATSAGGTFEELPMNIPPKEPTWRQRAKVLGIPLHKEPPGTGMRKKEDVLADMARLGEPPQETKSLSDAELLGNIEKVDKKETDAQIPEELRTEE